jgi:hypothetical protein
MHVRHHPTTEAIIAGPDPITDLLLNESNPELGELVGGRDVAARTSPGNPFTGSPTRAVRDDGQGERI